MRPKNVEVPPHFRCPISFELMEDPVILCTGITYDRGSIVRWLDEGNQFCPVTKLLLCSKELIPNCTLQHLISSWCTTNMPPAAARAGSGDGRPRTGSQLVQLVENAGQELDYDSVVALSRCSVEHSVWKKAVESEGFLAALAAPFHERTGPFQGEEQRLFVLLKMSQQLEDGVAEMLSDCLGCQVLVSLLDKDNSLRTRVLAAQLLEKIGFEEAGSCAGLVKGLLELLRPDIGSLSELGASEEEEAVQETALRCLVKACNRLGNKAEAIRLGAVPLLVDILVTSKACKNQPVRTTKTKQQNNKSKNGKASGIVEYALALLRAMSSCAEGRESLAALHDKAMQGILNDMLKSSAQSVEHGVVVLWTCLGHSDKFEQSFVEADGLVTMAMVLQSHCTPLAKHKAAQVLKHFSWLWKEQA